MVKSPTTNVRGEAHTNGRIVEMLDREPLMTRLREMIVQKLH